MTRSLRMLTPITLVAILVMASVARPGRAQHLPGQYVPPGAYVPPGTLNPHMPPLGPRPGFPEPHLTAPSTLTPEQARPAPLRSEPIPERRPSSHLLLREYEPLVRGLNRRDCLAAFDPARRLSRTQWRILCDR